MMFTKKYNLANRWHTMILTEKELEKVIKEHGEYCNGIMKDCLDIACEFPEIEVTKSIQHIQLAKSLFDKRCLTLYSFIQTKLDEKIQKEIGKFEKERKRLTDEKENRDY